MHVLKPLTLNQMDSVYTYAEALHEGIIEPPEGVELSSDASETIRQMISLRTFLRVPDYNSIDAVRQTLAVLDPSFVAAAMNFVPPDRTLN